MCQSFSLKMKRKRKENKSLIVFSSEWSKCLWICIWNRSWKTCCQRHYLILPCCAVRPKSFNLWKLLFRELKARGKKWRAKESSKASMEFTRYVKNVPWKVESMNDVAMCGMFAGVETQKHCTGRGRSCENWSSMLKQTIESCSLCEGGRLRNSSQQCHLTSLIAEA